MLHSLVVCRDMPRSHNAANDKQKLSKLETFRAELDVTYVRVRESQNRDVTRSDPAVRGTKISFVTRHDGKIGVSE